MKILTIRHDQSLFFLAVNESNGFSKEIRLSDPWRLKRPLMLPPTTYSHDHAYPSGLLCPCIDPNCVERN